MKPIWIWQSHNNITHQIGSQSITPVTQSIGLRLDQGGWLWQFPRAVEVKDVENGTQTRLPIPDPTRTLVWLLTALTLLLVIATVVSLGQSRQRTPQEKTKG
jgi:hypothetical protein